MSKCIVPQSTHCCHHWIISRPNGSRSDAQCELCYEERTFLTPYQSTYGNPQQKFPKITLGPARLAEDWND